MGLNRFRRDDANPYTKSNTPERIKDRYRRGTRRWSFFKGRKSDRYKPISTQNFWTIIVEESGGFYSSDPDTLTYTCDCPDFGKEIQASPILDDPTKPYSTKQYKPRTFGADKITHYKSSYARYLKGVALVPRVEFVGFPNSIQTEYKIWTDRQERYTRDWTSSDAGVDTDQYCKHIWAVILYRGDPFTVPDDMPDYLTDEAFELTQETPWILDDYDLMSY